MKRLNLQLAAGLALAAISLTFSATGLVHLFSGAGHAVTVMAVAFEGAKVAMTVWLLANWRWRPLQLLLAFALFCLTAVSSVGIYGYLGKAYAAGRTAAVQGSSTVAVLTEEVAKLEADADRMQRRIDAVPDSMPSTRMRVARQYAPDLRRIDSTLMVKREALGQARIGQVTTENDIGELRFAAELFGTTQDGLAKLVITTLAFLLDPLAVLLLLASGAKSGRKAVPFPAPVSETEPVQWTLPRDEEAPAVVALPSLPTEGTVHTASAVLKPRQKDRPMPPVSPGLQRVLRRRREGAAVIPVTERRTRLP